MDADRALMCAITDLVDGEPVEGILEALRAGTREGALLAGSARVYYDMAVELLEAGDVDEAEKCLWAARAEHLSSLLEQYRSV